MNIRELLKQEDYLIKQIEEIVYSSNSPFSDKELLAIEKLRNEIAYVQTKIISNPYYHFGASRSMH